MIYSSTPPINDDPEPYTELTGTYAPRPEFDRPRAHEANPILLKFRSQKYRSHKGQTLSERAEDWRITLANYDRWYFVDREGWTIDQIDHAYRVLERLTKL